MPAKLQRVQQLRLTASGESLFNDAVLPGTIELASLVRPLLERHLKTPTTWPFEDRVLVHLAPHFNGHTSRFHERGGTRLDRLHGSLMLRRLDEELFDLLSAEVDRLLALHVRRLRSKRTRS